MIEIGAFEAKNTLGALLDRVEQGEEVVITRYGRPVARLTPNVAVWDRTAARAAAQRIRDRAVEWHAKTGGDGSFDWQQIKAQRDAGRP